MMIKQYFLMTDYSLWKVILNGDSPTLTRVIEGVVQPVAPTTAEQRLARKNELKAREKRFGWNKETKKVQKNLLKQQYENFICSSSKSLDQIHDRLQKLISQLEILGESLSQEDINLKFLRSLPTEWRTHTLIWRNKTDLEEQSLDDLFNSLKIYEAEVKISVIASVFAGSAKIPVSALPNVDTLTMTRVFKQKRNLPTMPSWPLPLQVLLILTMRKSQFDVISYKTGLESVEARLLVYQQNETVFEKDIKLLKLEVQLRENTLVVLRQKLEKAEQEINDLKLKLEKFQTSSTSLRDGYHVVPPPYTGTFRPPKPDLVFHDAPNVNETVHTAFNVELSPTKPDNNLSYTYRPSAPIIEDWVSDSEEDSKAEISQNAPSFVTPAEQVKTPRPSVKTVETSILTTNTITTIPKPKSNGNCRNRKACFVCKSLDYLINDYDFYKKKMAQTSVRNHERRGNHQQYARMTLPNPQKHVIPTAVLTKSKLVHITAARPVTAVVLKPLVTRPRQAKIVVTKPRLPPRRNINLSPSPKANTFPLKVTAAQTPMVNVVKGNWGNPQHALKDKGVINSGRSRHMTGNMSYMSYFEELNGGYVTISSNSKGGKISGKGKIRTGKLDSDDVYFVKELKFNLFSVSHMCDKKNNVLFIDTKCLVLSLEFKLPDENQVLLRVPRENNMYNVDLKNIVPSGDLTCLFAKTTLDESNLWHRRLGHINFKTMNKLVKGNLVRGLPIKVFENDHTCVACKKGKQHRAACKTKPVSSVNQPLQ
nr:putative ribonuclease H-like domain-containing protein [Tanacetum cinerariifolium]